jgi:hypothetical protein
MRSPSPSPSPCSALASELVSWRASVRQQQREFDTAVHHDHPSLALEPGDDPVPRCCVVSVDSIESVALGVRTERIGRLADLRMRQLCKALEVAVDCDRWLSAHLRASPRPAVGAGRRLAAVRS